MTVKKNNMKRIITTILSLLFVLSMNAQKASMTVNVKQPGTLAACIGEKNKKSVERLTILGKLNSADVVFLREMMGRDTKGHEVAGGRLTNLNLLNTTFMADTTCFVRGEKFQANLGEGGSDLPEYLFYGCRLSGIIFPEGMKRIGASALRNTVLKEIILPENVTIEALAFADCKELTQVTFPQVLNAMYSAPFYGCDKLENIVINNIYLFGGFSFKQMNALRSITIKGWCVHVDNLCFDCPELRTIDFYGAVMATGGPVFANNCPKFETVTFHAPVYNIRFGQTENCQVFKGVVSNDLVLNSMNKDMIPVSPLEKIVTRFDSLKTTIDICQNQFRERMVSQNIDQIDRTFLERDLSTARRILDRTVYDMACRYSLRNEREKALDLFEKTVADGFREYYHFLKDSDLNNIREEVRFKALMADLKTTEDKINKLKASAEYVKDGKRSNVTFSYQSPSDSILTAIREYFNLDSIAGDGNEISRIKRIMYWLHDAIRHDGNSSWPNCRYNAIELYELTKRENRGLNCRFMSEVLNDLYLAAGFKSRFVTCQSKEYDADNDCHVINIVWSDDLGKWIWMDASFAAYVTDENGILLHPGEVRERLRKEQPVFLNGDANWNHKTPQTKDEYINYYMAKNLYLFDSHVRSETESEGRDGDKSPIVTLVPQGFVFNSGKVTEDEAEFWQRP